MTPGSHDLGTAESTRDREGCAYMGGGDAGGKGVNQNHAGVLCGFIQVLWLQTELLLNQASEAPRLQARTG